MATRGFMWRPKQLGSIAACIMSAYGKRSDKQRCMVQARHVYQMHEPPAMHVLSRARPFWLGRLGQVQGPSLQGGVPILLRP